MVLGKEALSVEYKDDPIGQWPNLPWKKREYETTEKWKELTWPEDNTEDNQYETVLVEEEDENEALIKMTHEVLQHHRGKRGRSPLPKELPSSPPKKIRKRRGGKASKRAKARYIDDKQQLATVDLAELRYSQLSRKETFSCGRSVSQLVRDLLRRRVRLSAPFLRLTVFETTDEKTNEPILRCIDNRRLFALKEYAKKSGKDRVMVNVNLFSENTLTQVQRFIQNSDDTEGRHVRLRRNKSTNRRQPWIRNFRSQK